MRSRVPFWYLPITKISEREKIVASNSGIPIYDYYAITIPSAAKANVLNDLPLMDTNKRKTVSRIRFFCLGGFE